MKEKIMKSFIDEVNDLKHQVKNIEKGRAIAHSIGGPGAAYAAIIVMAKGRGWKNP